MFESDSFIRLTDEIASQGYDLETASRFAALIGDTPIFHDNGDISVQSGCSEIARLKPLKFFRSESGAAG